MRLFGHGVRAYRISGRGSKTQADQGFEPRARPFSGPPSGAHDRNPRGAGHHEWSDAPNEHAAFSSERAPRARRGARKSPVLPGRIVRPGRFQRLRMTVHWWACACADSASSNCGCAPGRRCAPTKPNVWQWERAPLQPRFSRAARSAPRGCAMRSSHRVRAAVRGRAEYSDRLLRRRRWASSPHRLARFAAPEGGAPRRAR